MVIVKKFIQKTIHPWDLKPEEAIALQTKLARRVIRKSRIRPADIVTVAGVDAAYGNDRAYAAVVVIKAFNEPCINSCKGFIRPRYFP
jgi:deoxyinosine 3'endonuclease (endonuclease V)